MCWSIFNTDLSYSKICWGSLHPLHAILFVYWPLHVWMLRTVSQSFLLKIDIQQCYLPQNHLLSPAFSQGGIVGLVIHMLFLCYTERGTGWVLPYFQVKPYFFFQGGVDLPVITWYCLPVGPALWRLYLSADFTDTLLSYLSNTSTTVSASLKQWRNVSM